MRERTLILLLRSRKRPSSALKPKSQVEWVHIPLLSFQALPHHVPKTNFETLVVTSAESFRFLRVYPPVQRVLCIGEKTASAAPAVYRDRLVVLKESHQKALLRYFQKQKPQHLFFPRSAWADPETVRKLRRQGHRVCVRHIYRPQLLKKKKKILAFLNQKASKWILISSPSIWRALRKNVSLAELNRSGAKLMAIGPTTAQALKSKGIFVFQADSPDLAAVARLAAKQNKKKKTQKNEA